MVHFSEEYNRVLLCVSPDVDLIKSCGTMFSSDDTLDREEAMEECQVNDLRQLFSMPLA